MTGYVREKGRGGFSQGAHREEGEVMGEATLYERVGGIFAIAAVLDNVSDRLVRTRGSLTRTPSCTSGKTVTYHTRMPGKWGRRWWVAEVSRGPFKYIGREMCDAHFDLKISREVFDIVLGSLPPPWMSSKCPSAKRERSVPLG
jgi:hemoglobin